MKYLVIIVLLQFLTLNYGILQAQWVQTNGPYGGNVNCLAVNGTNIFAGTDAGYIFQPIMEQHGLK